MQLVVLAYPREQWVQELPVSVREHMQAVQRVDPSGARRSPGVELQVAVASVQV